MKPHNIKTGDVLYIGSEDLPILVVMASEKGIRYIEPMDPQFDDHGNILTVYVSFETLGEWTISLGSITNISATLMGKK